MNNTIDKIGSTLIQIDELFDQLSDDEKAEICVLLSKFDTDIHTLIHIGHKVKDLIKL